MSKKEQDQRTQRQAKPGSDPEESRKVGGKGDFGAAEGNVIERGYVSQNTKASDRGAAQPHAGATGGRTAGAGGQDSGPGASSGGDVDTDVIGVATGRGLSESGPSQRPPGPDDSEGTSDEFATGKPGTGRDQTNVHQVGGKKQVEGGSTVHAEEPGTQVNPAATGADAATNPEARGDDSFAGEVSSGEATGRDSG